jgi:molybdopterin adenylyltransferase
MHSKRLVASNRRREHSERWQPWRWGPHGLAGWGSASNKDADRVLRATRLPAFEPRTRDTYNPPVDAPTSHRADAPASVRVFVLTISDSRTEATDTVGAAIVEALRSAGHTISGRKILKDDPEPVAAAVRAATVSADVVITTGGTGITSRDSTYEALARLFEKRLDGFGELFRMLSYEQVGAAAMLSRACAGTIRKSMVFALPGSEKAVRLAMEKLILPELGHVVRELKR